MLSQITDDPRFSLSELILPLISGAIGIIKPEACFWLLPIALLPLFVRLGAGKFSLASSAFTNALVGVFLLTALIGGTLGYNQVAAYQKLYFIIISILVYYALNNQPPKNIAMISIGSFGLGIGIATYFFLTRDFTASGSGVVNKVFAIWMELRPHLKWTPIPSGYIPGLILITVPFILRQYFDQQNPLKPIVKTLLVAGLVFALLTILVTTSLSVWFAVGGALATSVLWIGLVRFSSPNTYKMFPWLVFVWLVGVIAFIYAIGPVTSVSYNNFGSNSRLEVFTRSSSFLLDYPILGGGLASFPGQYSQYILGIPYFYFSNSYNLFLDIAVEQGLFGGIAFLLLYIRALFQASRQIPAGKSSLQVWLAMFVLIFTATHGLMQDYLYYNAGTLLLFFPLGMAKMLTQGSPSPTTEKPIVSTARYLPVVLTAMLITGLFLFRNQLIATWYSNLGAVQLAQVELADFPQTGWHGLGILPKLQTAETSLQTSLQFDPANLTANHRLGLIYMARRDFVTASNYLEVAYAQAPRHRGILKALGYCYLWMGEKEKAQPLLAQVSEVATAELDAYYWWWSNQKRQDLANKAFGMKQALESATLQP